jgi:hypothetical protein
MATDDLQQPVPRGDPLADAAGLPSPLLDLLTAAVLLTAVGVFMVGNLLLLDPAVLHSSARVTLICVGVLLIFFALSRRLGSPAWGLLLSYGALWLLLRASAPLAQLLFLAGAGGAAVYAWRVLRIAPGQWIALLLMAAVAAITVLGVHRSYTSFDMLARLAAGFVHQDTLYHASLAAMIKHYGVVSTGLHGLVVTPYHAFSHALMAAISMLSGVSVIEVYGVATVVLFAPLLIFSVVAASSMIATTRRVPLPAAWALTTLILALAPSLLQNWAVYDSYFVSESYLIALGLLTLGLPLLFVRELKPVDLLLVTLLTLMIAHSKAPVALMYAGLWLARLLFVRGGRLATDLAACALSALTVAAAVLGYAHANSGMVFFGPLDFVIHYTRLGRHVLDARTALVGGAGIPLDTALMASLALISFVLAHFLLSWIVVAAVARRSGWRSLLATPLAVYTLAAMGGGILIALTLRIHGASGFYFTNVAFFVALPGLVAMLAVAIARHATGARWLLPAAVVTVALVNGAALYRVSAAGRPYPATHNLLVEQLRTLRVSAPPNQVLRPDPAMLDANPLLRCSSKPFLFPAVSERPWVGVVRAGDDCRFEHYGYNLYGLSREQNVVSMAPRLLPGMLIVDVPVHRGQTLP